MAAGFVEEEIFNRRKCGYDSDFLDDTALITAFDNAIKPIKAKLGDTQFADVANKTAHGQSKKKEKKHKKHKKKSGKKSNSTALHGDCEHNWQVGNRCRCTYSEDGMIYNAVIISLDDDGQMCTVRYDYYNNEERQRIRDLLPPAGDVDAPVETSSLASDLESFNGTESSRFGKQNGSFKSPRSTSDRQRSHRSQKSAAYTQIPQAPWGFRGPHTPSFAHMPPPPPLPQFLSSFPHMPPSFHRRMPSFQRIPNVPLIPPPPPPMLSDAASPDNEKEALYTMLISWYMSGYHTGFYEGLKMRDQRKSEADDEDSTSETASSARE